MCFAATVTTFSLSLAKRRADVRPTTPALREGIFVSEEIQREISCKDSIPNYYNSRHLKSALEAAAQSDCADFLVRIGVNVMDSNRD